MTITTVSEFANELKRPTQTLLEQLKAAGVPKATAADTLTDADKHKLLAFLQSSHGTAGAERKKITLVKKQTTEIKQADASGKARTIQVEVRKKRTFIRREDGSDALADATAPAAPQAPLIDEAELARREEEARRQAELLRRQEEELAQRRREREESEARERAAAEQAAAQEKATQASEATATPAPRRVGNKIQPSAEELQAQQAKEDAKAAAEQARLDSLAQAAAASKAASEEDAARAAELGDRRRKAEAEASAIRMMMSTPKKVLVAKKPEEAKPAVDAKSAVKGTLHKPAAGSTVAKAKPGGAPGAGTGKEVKSAKLSSSWAGDTAKKKKSRPVATRVQAPDVPVTGAPVPVANADMTATTTKAWPPLLRRA